jgi:hypothetical protein
MFRRVALGAAFVGTLAATVLLVSHGDEAARLTGGLAGGFAVAFVTACGADWNAVLRQLLRLCRRERR